MKILMIFDGDYPWDVRVEKVTRALMRLGHDILLVCRNKSGAAQRREQLDDGLRIERVPAIGPAALSLPVFLSPLWVSTVWGAARGFQPDLILARDLPMAPLAVAVARARKVPVVADLAEPYPDSLRSIYQFNDPSFIDRFVRNPKIADWVERAVVRRIDEAIVVCPEAQERLERVGLPSGRCTVVRNTPDSESLVRAGRAIPVLAEWKEQFIILFSGLLAGDRGLDTAIQAMQRLEKKRPGRFRLLIVGDGPVHDALKTQTHQLELSACIRFMGRVPYAELADIIEGCSLGILPFRQCPHIDASLANKLFEYMSLGLPVVASDVPPHRRVIQDAGNGLLSAPGDAERLSQAILSCEENPEQLAAFARAGLKAVRDGYSWNHDVQRLRLLIERFADHS